MNLIQAVEQLLKEIDQEGAVKAGNLSVQTVKTALATLAQDPLAMPLPADIKIGAINLRQGVPLRILTDMAIRHQATAQQAAEQGIDAAALRAIGGYQGGHFESNTSSTIAKV